jgi:hypothetical protein
MKFGKELNALRMQCKREITLPIRGMVAYGILDMQRGSLFFKKNWINYRRDLIEVIANVPSFRTASTVLVVPDG